MTRRAKRKVFLAVAVCLLCAFVVMPHQAATESQSGSAEKLLFDSANRERAALGLGLLKWDEALAVAARVHATHMAEQHALSHQFPGEPDLLARIRAVGARFVALAENVAEGPRIAELHGQWMKSPPHRENLLNPQMNALGIGIDQRGGMFFAVEDFSQAVVALNLAEQQREVAAQLKSRGVRLIADQVDARRMCETSHLAGSGRGGSFALRYSTIEPSSLPHELTRELEAGHYRSASVAACDPAAHANFSGYQLGVVLYP